MLRKIRIILAVLFVLCITLLFLDWTGLLQPYLGWMAKIQILPAFLALNAGVVVGLVVLTYLFGRVYCSVICPLGVFQDLVSWISSKRKGKKNRFSYKKNHKWLRYGVLALFIILLVAGLNSIAILIAPYSAYGRMVTNLIAPLTGAGYAASLPTIIVAAVTFLIIVILAWTGGRTWCNNICPVGTILGIFSKVSIFRPVIDTDKCINCGLCGKRCKASCIDTKEHKIDYSRCVSCMDCLENCSKKAISYTWRRPVTPKDNKSDKVDGKSRRDFLAITAMAASAATLEAKNRKVSGAVAALEDKKVPDRETIILPPGSTSARHFHQHCTACQLCVSECPNHVLRPSGKIGSLMQPEMSYERGFCRVECTRCGEVCPAGAIKKLTPVEKNAIQIGHAVVIPENCVVNTDDVTCGNCARHCPVGAIKLVPKEEGSKLRVPSVNTERCIGCGSCEFHCPARPVSAIYVEGHQVHKEN